MLNSSQKKAVEEISKPLIVVAGPGTGKTRTIVEKISYLLTKGIKEEEILALTFTEKAAQEMSERVEVDTNKPFAAKTFHSFALELMEEFSNQIPEIDSDFNLIDDANQMLFFIDNFSDLKFSSVEVSGKINQVSSELQSTISKLKDFGVSIKDLPSLKFEDETVKSDLLGAFVKYEKYKKDLKLIDFGDMLLYIFELLKKNNEVRDLIKNRFKYILVDEFQDTNKVQLEIIKQICENNITVVGDLKQSIYSFRGANIENLDEFKKHFKNFEEVYLTENYRSSKSVVESVNKLITKIASPKESLVSQSKIVGEVLINECSNERSQQTFILEKISEINDLNSEEKSIGILTRTKAQAQSISKFLVQFGINVSRNQLDNVFDMMSVKNMLKVLTIINNPKEANKEIFYLLSNSGIRSETLKGISRRCSRNERSMYKVICGNNNSEYIDEEQIVQDLCKKIKKLHDLKNTGVSLRELVLKTIATFNFYQNAILTENHEEVFSLNGFMNFAKTYQEIYKDSDLDKFLQVCELSKGMGLSFELPKKINGNVEIITIHQSKGKEYDYVILPFMNERKFPMSFKENLFRTPFDFVREQHSEDEKRLFFVALSRAKISSYLTYVKRYSDNKLDSKFSPFLADIDVKTEKYDKEVSDLDLEKKEKVKVDVLKKIQNLVFNNNFNAAKDEIDLLKDLYGGKKDLTSFMRNSHPELDNLKLKMAEKKDPLEVDFDTSDLVYSVSQLQTYETCPRKYMYQYVYKIPGKPRHYFDFGTTVHKVLELLMDEIDSIDKHELYELGMKYLEKHWISKGYESEQQETDYFEKGKKAVAEFIEKEYEIRKDGRETIAQELKFLMDVEGRKFTGFIDRIDKVGEDIEVIDYKTSNSMEIQSKLATNMQLMMYSMAINEEYSKLPKRVGLWYLVHDKILMTEPLEENISKVKEKVLDLIKGVESKNFKATPSHFGCRFCDFNDICDKRIGN